MATKYYLNTDELALKSDIAGKQDTLVNQQNIKSINGQSLLGAGNLDINTYKTFNANWDTTHTVDDFCASINSDSTAIGGNVYLGGVTFTDFPDQQLINTDIVVEIISGTGTSNKVIHIVMTSGSISPYHWEYTYWNNGSNTSGWISFALNGAPSGDGVAVLEFGGYVDVDTLESHLTLTKEEFLKGIDNDVAFAKVELDTNAGGTPVKVMDLYLTKLTGEYVEGQNGQLIFSSSFSMGGGPQLATLSVAMDDTSTPETWDIDFNVIDLTDSIGLEIISISGYMGQFTEDEYNKLISGKAIISNGTSNPTCYYLAKEDTSYYYFYTLEVKASLQNTQYINVQKSNRNWYVNSNTHTLPGTSISSTGEAANKVLTTNGSNGCSWQSAPIINQEEEIILSSFVDYSTLYDGDKVHFDTTKQNEFTNWITTRLMSYSSPRVIFSTTSNDATTPFNMIIWYDNNTNNYGLSIGCGSFGSPDLTCVFQTYQGIGFQNLDADGNYTIHGTNSTTTFTIQSMDDSLSWNGSIIYKGTPSLSPVGVDGNFYRRDTNIYKYSNNTYSKVIVEGEEGTLYLFSKTIPANETLENKISILNTILNGAKGKILPTTLMFQLTEINSQTVYNIPLSTKDLVITGANAFDFKGISMVQLTSSQVDVMYDVSCSSPSSFGALCYEFTYARPSVVNVLEFMQYSFITADATIQYYNDVDLFV